MNMTIKPRDVVKIKGEWKTVSHCEFGTFDVVGEASGIFAYRYETNQIEEHLPYGEEVEFCNDAHFPPSMVVGGIFLGYFPELLPTYSFMDATGMAYKYARAKKEEKEEPVQVALSAISSILKRVDALEDKVCEIMPEINIKSMRERE